MTCMHMYIDACDGSGHMTQHNVWRVRDETSVVGLGLEGLRDGSGTEGRTSHNRKACLLNEYWVKVGVWIIPHSIIRAGEGGVLLELSLVHVHRGKKKKTRKLTPCTNFPLCQQLYSCQRWSPKSGMQDQSQGQRSGIEM